MTSRDTYDIEQHEKEKKTTNIQPALLIKLMMEAEPCLFANKSKPAIKPYEISPNIFTMYMFFLEAARKHAKIQIDFDKSLTKQP
jgi:Fe-S-cluster containining protein